jgi:hypothetical protein
MLTHLGSDTGPDTIVKLNENFRRRLTPDVRAALNVAATQLSTDELVRVSATSAPRALALQPAATANGLLVMIEAADGVNTYTIDADGAETIDGTATKTYTAAKKLWLMPTSTSTWTVLDLT